MLHRLRHQDSVLSAGDPGAVLTGTRLDEVARASLNGVIWSPATLGRIQDIDRLAMHADASTAALEPGQHYLANVELRDGRELKVHTTVNPARPQIALLSKGSQDGAEAALPVQFGSQDDLPVENGPAERASAGGRAIKISVAAGRQSGNRKSPVGAVKGNQGR